MKLRPLHDWALIERSDAGEVTTGGIHIPDSARKQPSEGTIIAIGPGKYKQEKGKEKKKVFVPTTLVPGQRVMYARYMSTEIELDGHVYTLVREEDILCTVEGAEQPLTKAHAREVLVPSGSSVKKTPAVQKKKAGSAARKKSASPRATAKKKVKKAALKKKIKKSVKRTATKKTSRSSKVSPGKALKKTSKKSAKKKAVSKKTRSTKKVTSSKRSKKKK